MQNVWDESGILPMAIRLRKSGRCPGDIDNLYGEIMVGIVHMASVMLPKDDPRYECHRRDFLSEDVQSAMLVHALTAAEKYVDTEANPRRIVNYLVKAVQNRLRNWVRDSERRENRIDMVMECDLPYDIGERGMTVCNLDGSFAPADIRGKLITTEFN